MSSFRCMAKKYLRAGLTSGTIMASGDLLCQTWERRRAASSGGGDGGDVLSDAAASTSGRLGAPAAVQEQLGVMPAYDLARTARFFAVGMTFHGPFFVKCVPSASARPPPGLRGPARLAGRASS
jgi:protein Mpv17